MFGSLESWGKKSINDLPDIPIPAEQLQKIQEKYEGAKKLEIASQMSKDSQNLVKTTIFAAYGELFLATLCFLDV